MKRNMKVVTPMPKVNVGASLDVRGCLEAVGVSMSCVTPGVRLGGVP